MTKEYPQFCSDGLPTMEIEGLEYISMTAAARMFGYRNDRFGKILKYHLVPNGVRVFNTSKNNKGIKICREDLQALKDKATELNVGIIEIELVEK